MCRVLPVPANLEHLRNQAKDLLSKLQRDNPASKLADAQHALAREYGFASWPKLKVHVELLAPVAVAAVDHPFAGSWIVNVPKSTQHPANPFQSATIAIEVAGDSVTVTQSMVAASGQAERSKSTIQADGQEHPFGGSGYRLTATWHGRRVLETVATKDGQATVGGRYELSADGKTLVITDSSGEQRLVLERS